MKNIRTDKVKAAITETCAVFERLGLTDEEIEHLIRCIHEAIRQQAEKGKIKLLRYLPAAISLTAIIISAISIIASLLKF